MGLSKKSAAQLLVIDKSLLLKRFLATIHGLAIIAAVTNSLPWMYKVIAVTATGVSLFFYVQRYYYRFQPYQIKYSDESGWTLITGNTLQTITLLPSTVITTWFVVLHFQRSTGRFQSLLITKDALPHQDYCGLVMQLKTVGRNSLNNNPDF